MSSSNTSYSNLTLIISVTQRVTRYFGLSMDLAFPVAQKTKFSFTNAQTFNSTSQFSEFGSSTPLRYKPQQYKYAFKESPRISIFGRFFFETFINSYLDVRFSIFKINESFILKRASTLGNNDYPSVVEININYSKDHLQFIPGFT